MAIRLSDAATFMMAGDDGLRRALANAHMTFYTGTQPATAGATPGSSQPIIAFTVSDNQMVEETLATWEVVFSGLTGTAGLSSLTVDTFEILGASATAATLPLIADAVADQINDYVGNCGFTASSDGVDTVTITAPKATGVGWNSATLAATTTGTVTATETGGGAVVVSGVAGVDGLTFDAPLNGADLGTPESNFYIQKPAAEVWKGKNGFGPADAATDTVFTGITDGNSYTAGWGRICASPGDDGTGATSGEDGYIRVDFSVGTASEDFTMTPSASFTVNTTGGSEIESVINSFKLKVSKNPTAA